MTSCFSMPPMRCSSPGVPGRTHGPRERGGIAQVREEALRLRAELDVDGRQRLRIRDQPRLGAVGEEAVAQHDHRHHVLDRDAHGLVGDVEAVARRRRREHHASATRCCGRRAPASGRPARSWSAGRSTGPPRWMSKITSGSSAVTARPMPSLLSAMPGPLEPVTPMAPPKAAPMAAVDGRDLVLGLDRADAEALVHRQLFEDRCWPA